MNPMLRRATCNIHEDVQSIGPQCRREIRNLGPRVQQPGADLSARPPQIAEWAWPGAQL